MLGRSRCRCARRRRRRSLAQAEAPTSTRWREQRRWAGSVSSASLEWRWRWRRRQVAPAAQKAHRIRPVQARPPPAPAGCTLRGSAPMKASEVAYAWRRCRRRHDVGRSVVPGPRRTGIQFFCGRHLPSRRCCRLRIEQVQRIDLVLEPYLLPGKGRNVQRPADFLHRADRPRSPPRPRSRMGR